MAAALSTRYLVVGGGVAGTSCVDELCRVDPTASVTLISGSGSTRGVTNYVKLTDALESFDVEDVALSTLQERYPNLRCVVGVVVGLEEMRVRLSDGRSIQFESVCICTGAAPRVLFEHPSVLCIRDKEVGR